MKSAIESSIREDRAGIVLSAKRTDKANATVTGWYFIAAKVSDKKFSIKISLNN